MRGGEECDETVARDGCALYHRALALDGGPCAKGRAPRLQARMEWKKGQKLDDCGIWICGVLAALGAAHGGFGPGFRTAARDADGNHQYP